MQLNLTPLLLPYEDDIFCVKDAVIWYDPSEQPLNFLTIPQAISLLDPTLLKALEAMSQNDSRERFRVEKYIINLDVFTQDLAQELDNEGSCYILRVCPRGYRWRYHNF